MPASLKNRLLALLGRLSGTVVGASLARVGKSREPLPAAVEAREAELGGCWFVIAHNAPNTPADRQVTLTAVDGTASGDGPVRLRTRAGDLPVVTPPVLPPVWAPFGTETVLQPPPLQVPPMQHDDYRIAWVADDRAQIILARGPRDVVWLLSRRSLLSDAERRTAAERIRDLGYSLATLKN